MQGQLPSLQCTELKVGAKTPVWAPEAPSGFLEPSTILHALKRAHFWMAQPLTAPKQAKLKEVRSSPGERASKSRIKSYIRTPFLQAVLYWCFFWELWPHCCSRDRPLAFLRTHLLFHRRFLQVHMVCFCWTLHDFPQSFLFCLPPGFVCNSVSVLSKNLVMTENNLSLVSILCPKSFGSQCLLDWMCPCVAWEYITCVYVSFLCSRLKWRRIVRWWWLWYFASCFLPLVMLTIQLWNYKDG